jgi:hypothetical protein
MKQTAKMIRITKKKKFGKKFKEFRKKIWFQELKYRKYNRLVSIKMKEHSGIEHIAQMR